MITTLRSYLETWFARILFGVLVIAFASWGIGDMIRQLGVETWVAKVGDHAIEPPELQQAYQNELNRITRLLGGRIDATPEMKRGILDQALDQLVRQYAVGEEVRQLGLTVPDSGLAHDIAALPAFRGPDGKFSRMAFQSALRNAGMSEARFMDSLRTENAHQQLLEPIRLGFIPPDVLTDRVYRFTTEQREAGLVELKFSAATAAEPDEAQMRRWYDNHPDLYRTPEYRRIKVIVLSPKTLKDDIEITDEDLAAAYAARSAEFTTIAKRSVEVIATPDEAKAKALAQQWRGGANWEAMQKAATAAGAAPVALTDVTAAEIPDPALAKAVFDAAQDAVTGPIKAALGWQVARVTNIIAGGTKPLAEVAPELRARIRAEKAADIIYARATKVEDTLASGTSLDDMPANLGLAAATGTLDSLGNNLEGQPAPIPGPDSLRTALIAAVFEARQGDPPRLTEVTDAKDEGPAYFAFSVEEITPPGARPFDSVTGHVKDDLMQSERRRMQEAVAAKLLSAVEGGQSLEDAATVAGVPYRRVGPTGRSAPAEGVPREVVEPLFNLKQGKATMVETPEAFLVTTPLKTIETDPKTDEAGYGRIREALTQGMADDAEAVFLNALRQRTPPRINQKILDSFVQP
jgi:peptidyl-prolyl cis-trans isomerase D